MDGAPEGQLYEAKVIERDEVQAPENPSELLETVLEERSKMNEWHEKFSYADKLRQIALHARELVTPKVAKEVRGSTIHKFEASYRIVGRLRYLALPCACRGRPRRGD